VLSSPLQYLTSIPPVTRGISILLIVLPTAYSWLQLHDYDVTPYFTVVPGSIIWYPWTLISAAFIEETVLAWIFSFITILLSFRYLERLWGTIETIKFVVITVTISNAIAVVANWLEFVAAGKSEFFLYDMHYQGMTALQTGVLVAFTQLIPEHQIQILGFIKIRVKRLPMIYVTISSALCLTGYQSPWLLIQLGWLVSWIYLRFYKKNTDNTVGGVDTYGDRSETFAFVHWFPPFLHYPVSVASNVTYAVAVRLHLVRPSPTSNQDLEAGGSYNLLPGGARAEAERRRAMALKALDQRMANSASAQAAGAAGTSAAAPSNSNSPATGTDSTKATRPKEERDIGESSSSIVAAGGEKEKSPSLEAS